MAQVQRSSSDAFESMLIRSRYPPQAVTEIVRVLEDIRGGRPSPGFEGMPAHQRDDIRRIMDAWNALYPSAKTLSELDAVQATRIASRVHGFTQSHYYSDTPRDQKTVAPCAIIRRSPRQYDIIYNGQRFGFQLSAEYPLPRTMQQQAELNARLEAAAAAFYKSGASQIVPQRETQGRTR